MRSRIYLPPPASPGVAIASRWWGKCWSFQFFLKNFLFCSKTRRNLEISSVPLWSHPGPAESLCDHFITLEVGQLPSAVVSSQAWWAASLKLWDPSMFLGDLSRLLPSTWAPFSSVSVCAVSTELWARAERSSVFSAPLQEQDSTWEFPMWTASGEWESFLFSPAWLSHFLQVSLGGQTLAPATELLEMTG